MESPLTPLDFARRTRRLHGSREAVVDGDLRLTYEQFFGRCDRWSAALAGLGVRPGDRVVLWCASPVDAIRFRRVRSWRLAGVPGWVPPYCQARGARTVLLRVGEDLVDAV